VKKFVSDHTPAIVVPILILTGSLLFNHYWSDPSKTQALGGYLSFVAAAILIWVTWEYVRINQQTLSLQKAQWEQQNKVVLRFGVRRSHGKAQLWIANIGTADFLISEMRVRVRAEKPIVRNERRVVRAGTRTFLSLPETLWDREHLISTFDVRLRYESQQDSGVSQARGFTLLVGNASQVIKVTRGIDDSALWLVNCPKCRDLAPMVVDELANLDEAAERQKIMESELTVSCPQHHSQWMDSVEQLRNRRATHEHDSAKED